MEEKKNLRPKEAAKYLGVADSTLWHYLKQGKFKSHKISERVTIIKKEDLDSFINGETKCTTESKGGE